MALPYQAPISESLDVVGPTRKRVAHFLRMGRLIIDNHDPRFCMVQDRLYSPRSAEAEFSDPAGAAAAQVVKDPRRKRQLAI